MCKTGGITFKVQLWGTFILIEFVNVNITLNFWGKIAHFTPPFVEQTELL